MNLNSHHVVAFALMLSFCSNSYAGKMYKWVDKNGVVSYQDQPPPKNAKVLSEKTVGPNLNTEEGEGSGLPKVVVYTVENCESCDQVIALMMKAAVPHIELPLQSERQTSA